MTDTKAAFEQFVKSLYADMQPPSRLTDDDTLFNMEFEAWAEYRRMTHQHRAFQAMVTDVLDRKVWGPETIAFIDQINAMMNVWTSTEGENDNEEMDVQRHPEWLLCDVEKHRNQAGA